MRAILAAVHGILTRQTTTSWPDRLESWMWRRESKVLVLKKEYSAGPLPKLNCLIKDPLIARGLAAEIMEAVDGAGYRRQCPIWMVAHSNGAVIALKTAKILIAKGYRITGMILSGAACEANTDKNGIRQWCQDGTLGQAYAWSARDDGVLKMVGSGLGKVLAWPYGDLGRRGFVADYVGDPSDQIDRDDVPKEVPYGDARIHTEWFSGGHSCYWHSDGAMNRSFELIYQRMKGATMWGTNTDQHGPARTNTCATTPEHGGLNA